MPLNDRGWEVLDNTPIAKTVRVQSQSNRYADLRQMLRIAQLEAAQSGKETFEESDDFDVGDDYDPKSPWEIPADEFPITMEEPQSGPSGSQSTPGSTDDGTPSSGDKPGAP